MSSEEKSEKIPPAKKARRGNVEALAKAREARKLKSIQKMEEKLATEKARLAPKRESQPEEEDDSEFAPVAPSVEPESSESEEEVVQYDLVPKKKAPKKAPKPKPKVEVEDPDSEPEPAPKPKAKPRVTKAERKALTIDQVGAMIEDALSRQRAPRSKKAAAKPKREAPPKTFSFLEA